MRTIPRDPRYYTVAELSTISGRSLEMIRTHLSQGRLTAVDIWKMGWKEKDYTARPGGARLRTGILPAEAKRWLACHSRNPETVLPEGVSDVWVPAVDILRVLGRFSKCPYEKRYDQGGRDIEFGSRGTLRAWPLSRWVGWWNGRAPRLNLREPTPFPFDKFPLSAYPKVDPELLMHDPMHRLDGKRLQAAWRALTAAGVIVPVQGNGTSHEGRGSSSAEQYRIELHEEAVRALGRALEAPTP